MNNFIAKYFPQKDWLIEYSGFSSEDQRAKETQLALGNGFFCTRGILEERPEHAHPGTYMAGVYDKSSSKVEDLVNLPNPVSMRLAVKGEKLDVSIMPHSLHKRYLNMQQGILLRRTKYRTVTSGTIDYQSIRFISMANKNICAMRTYVTALDKSITLSVGSDLDMDVFNVSGIEEGKKRHFIIREIETSEKKIKSYAKVETLNSHLQVAYAHTLEVKLGRKTWFSNDEHIEVRLKKGETIQLTKYFALCSKHRKDNFDLKKCVEGKILECKKFGFDKLLDENMYAWKKRWERSDVIIKGEKGLQRTFRFNLYHLLICSLDDNGHSSIGAKTLSGEGYRGHIFWDTEIFVLPFFIYTDPLVAKSLLMYRVHRISQAHQIAKKQGYKGAMFPWESARTGEEETPTWAKDFDGRVIRIRTNEQEHHITADIAFAVYKYYVATEDEKFMLEHGYELLVETARFWESRFVFNKSKGVFEIRNVIGPDEFHEGVDNNAYTNAMARWNIFIAFSMLEKLKHKDKAKYTQMISKLKIDNRQKNRWKRIIEKVCFKINKNGIVEQFDGFSDLKEIPVNEFDQQGMPEIPSTIDLKDVGQYNILKQADVVMLLYTLPDLFTRKQIKDNYNFYQKKTVHKSSLSPSMHAIIAADIGNTKEAYKYYSMSSNTDLLNLHKNTREGMHAANLGGTWQMLVHGFAGVNVFKNTLCFYPRLPKQIRSLKMNFHWKGFLLKIEMKNNVVKIDPGKRVRHQRPSRRDNVKIKIFNKTYNLSNNKKLIIKRS